MPLVPGVQAALRGPNAAAVSTWPEVSVGLQSLRVTLPRAGGATDLRGASLAFSVKTTELLGSVMALTYDQTGTMARRAFRLAPFTLTVNAPRQAVFGIAVAPSASGCIPIPGLANALVLDAPFFTLALGVVSQQSPVRACWDGRQDLSLPLPQTLPSGFQFATKAVAAATDAQLHGKGAGRGHGCRAGGAPRGFTSTTRSAGTAPALGQYRQATSGHDSDRIRGSGLPRPTNCPTISRSRSVGRIGEASRRM